VSALPSAPAVAAKLEGVAAASSRHSQHGPDDDPSWKAVHRTQRQHSTVMATRC